MEDRLPCNDLVAIQQVRGSFVLCSHIKPVAD